LSERDHVRVRGREAAYISPGRRKVAADKLFVALMPVHTAPNNKPLPHIASRTIFQFNLTVRQV
jgi:hypothetical protein